MITVWKFELGDIDHGTKRRIEMPQGAEILHAECQYHRPCVWARVDPQAPTESRLLLITGTGLEAPSEHEAKHVATFQQGAFVWHLWEMK